MPRHRVFSLAWIVLAGLGATALAAGWGAPNGLHWALRIGASGVYAAAWLVLAGGMAVSILPGARIHKHAVFWVFSGLVFAAAGTAVMFALCASPLMAGSSVYSEFWRGWRWAWGWTAAVLALAALQVIFEYPEAFRAGFLSPWRRSVWIAGGIGLYILVLRFLQHEGFIKAPYHFWPPLAILAGFLLTWGAANQLFRARTWLPSLNQAGMAVLVFLTALVLYRQTADWLGLRDTPAQAYWPELAEAFLAGRFYLIDPATTHDLTRFGGNWYVPNPPLAALVMLPLALLRGGGEINTVHFSIFFGALNVLLFYLALQKARPLGWVDLERPGQLVLCALFAFGTPLYWVTLDGQVWFVSQVLAVTASGVVILATMHARFGLAGIGLAAAVLARPSLAVLWVFPALLAARPAWQPGRFAGMKQAAGALLRLSAAPALAVALLLLYNQARFGSLLDFGYVSINGSETIVRDVQQYGMFHPVFIWRNLQVMFLGLPRWVGQTPFLLPEREGMSLFLATPALIFLFHRKPRALWVIGAAGAVVLTVGMLLCYHNTGSAQFGYRYLSDFIFPLFLLLASGLGRKLSTVFILLAGASILINLLGAVWWFWY